VHGGAHAYDPDMSTATRFPPNAVRRKLLRGAAALAALTAVPARAASGAVRIGLTPVFLDDQVGFLLRWRTWLEERLERPVMFVQRSTYRETVDLVLGGKLDFAWICGYPYVMHRRHLRLCAVPLWRGRPYYQSYIIVPADDARTRSIYDLRGKVFAYSDPDSNSGCLFPRYLLTMRGENPATFFSHTFFTLAHRKVVEAVGAALADGGAVDGYVWETLAELRPEFTRATRVVERSGDMGHTPFVARANIPSAEFARFQGVLLGMRTEPRGAELLRELNLDGFVAGNPSLYDGIARMAARVSPT
jgi:phosphonate transport system substrate-binding protein